MGGQEFYEPISAPWNVGVTDALHLGTNFGVQFRRANKPSRVTKRRAGFMCRPGRVQVINECMRRGNRNGVPQNPPVSVRGRQILEYENE